MNGTLKRLTADVYAVVKDEEKVTVGAPPVATRRTLSSFGSTASARPWSAP